MKVTYRRYGDGPNGSRWMVDADGEPVGYVEQVRVAYGRPTHKGSRIVSRYTYSNRWRAEDAGAGVHYDRRYQAAAALLERKRQVPYVDALPACQAGKVVSR